MKQLTTREKNLLIVGLAVLISAVLISYVIQPLWESYQQTSIQLDGARQRLAVLKKAEIELANKGAMEEMLQQLAEVDKKLPNKPETAEIAYYVQKAVSGPGAVPGNAVVEEQQESGIPGLMVNQVTINASGTYDNIKGIVRNLESFPRVAWIQQATITKEDPPKTGLRAEFILNTYFMPQNKPYVNNVVPKVSPEGKTNPF